SCRTWALPGPPERSARPGCGKCSPALSVCAPRTVRNISPLRPSCGNWKQRPMSITDLGVAALAGIVGFGIIWGLFGLIRQQRAAPVELFKTEPKTPVESGARLSVTEL